MPGRLEFDLGFGRTGPPRDDGEPMRLLVLGDFSGKAAADRPPLARRPTQQVDIDNLDDVVRRLEPRIRVPSGEIHFTQIDDFHPDRLYTRLDLFQALRRARTNPPAATDDLGRLLGKPAESSPAPAVASASTIDALVRNIVAPYIVKDTSADTEAYLLAVDTAIAEQMRALLHDPAFQRAESACRGLELLLEHAQDAVEIHVISIPRRELGARFRDAVSPGFDPDRDLQRIGLANQTTMLMSESLRVQELFRQAMVDRYGEAGMSARFRAFDTICSATQDRQDAVVNLLKEQTLDLMIVIGGYNSSNTCNLARICAEKVPTFHIADPECLESAEVIRHRPAGGKSETRSEQWLPRAGQLTIGLTSGASTPDNQVGATVKRLAALSNQ